MPTLIVNGEPLFYAVHPARDPDPQPVILLHGAGANHLAWSADLRRQPGATVYALDLPGHGRSGGHGRNTVEAYADAVHAWREAAGLGPAVWIGHSLGAAIALDLALRHPEGGRKLVLIGAAARFALPPAVLRDLTANPARAVDALVELAAGPDAPPVLVEATRRMMRELPPDVLRGDFEAAAAFDAHARLGEVRAPTLVITAQDDRLTPPDDARQLVRGISGAKLLSLPHGGHLAAALAPAALRNAILDFTKA